MIRCALALAFILFGAGASSAFETVVCFADSIGNLPGPTTNWCSRLQALRPDLVVKNRSAGGRDTVLALSQATMVADEACGPASCLVLIHHGINDLLLADEEPDPLRTARRLRAAWARIRGGNRDAWVLTPLPFLDFTPHNNDFARDVGNALIGLMRRHEALFDARDLFALQGWAAHTTDGVHPNEAGAEVMAQALAAAIP